MKIQKKDYSPKVLVIPRNRWLFLSMTEKLFTGTLNHNQNKTKQTKKKIFFGGGGVGSGGGGRVGGGGSGWM